MDTSALRKAVIERITLHCGVPTGRVYEIFYADKTPDVILQTAHQLFEEMVGAAKARQILEELRTQTEETTR